MNFIRRKNRECFLHDTQVENIFINEYLPAAPGDYVKVLKCIKLSSELRVYPLITTHGEKIFLLKLFLDMLGSF